MNGHILRAVAGLSGLLAAAMLAQHADAAERPPLIWAVQADQLEYRLADGEDVLAWDAEAVAGYDEVKLRLLSKGELGLDEEKFETLEHQLLVQSPISDFFDAKAGIRLDTPAGPDQLFGVVGVQGLAQQWIAVDLDLYLSEDGDLSSRLDAEYELLLTNRLILIPRVEIDLPFDDDRERDLGAWTPTIEVGARLGYDLVDRAIVPYVGVYWERAFGESADRARRDSGEAGTLAAVAGLRLLF